MQLVLAARGAGIDRQAQHVVRHGLAKRAANDAARGPAEGPGVGVCAVPGFGIVDAGHRPCRDHQVMRLADRVLVEHQSLGPVHLRAIGMRRRCTAKAALLHVAPQAIAAARQEADDVFGGAAGQGQDGRQPQRGGTAPTAGRLQRRHETP
ncbi:hypothetical protein D9M72_405180 [compost metagenome]